HASDVGSAGDGSASGNYPGRVLTRSLYTRATQHPVATTAAVAVGAAALVA
ncbi:MAG TPA: short-chain dehydrogenase, partial [Pseudomonas sp.]|nr:short-chain dehydrogenase [Pseudomonas sp.]